MNQTSSRSEGRRQGLKTLGLGLLSSAIAFGIVRAQWVAGSTRLVVPTATVLGAVCVAIGLFQIITGRDRSRGLGIVGIVFAALFGFVGTFAGFMFAMPRAHPVEVAPTEDEMARKMANDISTEIRSSITTPAPTHQ
ncbi:MAG TPA: hypothetical protein VGM90_19490 [Kofleriaceae bacterium]|jgi:hypothetical protein